MWPFDAIADAVHDGLVGRDRALREEQAVRGLDSLDEVGLQPIIAAGIEGMGFGVLRERPYPHEWERKRRENLPAGAVDLGPAPPEHRDRQRCDLVVTERPGQTLDDAWEEERSERERIRQAAGTLFEPLAAGGLGQREGAPGGVRPEEALWLEIKSVAQFDCSSGAAGPSRAYAGQIARAPIADLDKLAADKRIIDSGVLVLAFTADAETAAHDLGVLAHRCLDRGLPIVPPVSRTLAIPDRMGNSSCTVVLIGMRREAP